MKSSKKKKAPETKHGGIIETVERLAIILNSYHLDELEVCLGEGQVIKLKPSPKNYSDEAMQKAIESITPKAVTDEEILFDPFAGLEEN